MSKSRATLIAIPKTIMPIAISMVVTAAGQQAGLSRAILDLFFVQDHKSYRVASAHARIQDTSQKRSARLLVTLRNGLVMAIAMIRITRADATGMVGIAAVTTGISNSAHTVCAKIRIMGRSSGYGCSDFTPM